MSDVEYVIMTARANTLATHQSAVHMGRVFVYWHLVAVVCSVSKMTENDDNDESDWYLWWLRQWKAHMAPCLQKVLGQTSEKNLG